MTHSKRMLLIIDPQNDFCDLPPEICGGNTPALPVPGAHADMQRLSKLIERRGGSFGDIVITLDTHRHLDIGHPGFWKQGNGGAVSPYTLIRAEDVRADTYRPRAADAKTRVLAYLDALEAAGRYTHMVWPTHCELGSWGHNLHAAVLLACNRWEEKNGRNTHIVLKGLYPWTEHYSAIRAEVPDPDAPETQTNMALLQQLQQAEQLLIAGEASSHCVKATVEDIVADLPQLTERIVLLTDCMSAVKGFEEQQQAFFAALQSQGAKLATSAEIE